MSVEVKLMYLPEHRGEGGASKLRWAQRSYSAPYEEASFLFDRGFRSVYIESI